MSVKIATVPERDGGSPIHVYASEGGAELLFGTEQQLNFSPVQARSLAAVLVAAASEADRMRLVRLEERALGPRRDG